MNSVPVGNEGCFYYNLVSHFCDLGNRNSNKHITNANIHHKCYTTFVKMEYSYLWSVISTCWIPRVPLPLCFKKGIKQAFPEEKGKHFTGFVDARAKKK